MLIDLLNSQNYIMVNMDAIQTFGLTTAVYCAELLNVYKKAILKNKLVDEEQQFFKVDRDFITKRTSISIDEQLSCDSKLLKVNVIEFAPENPDVIRFNVEAYASILSSEDVRLLSKVAETVVKPTKGVNKNKKDRIVANLKSCILCSNEELLLALYGWIDTICSTKGALTKPQVIAFKNDLDKYTQGDLDLALDIVKIATIHSFRDCQWAINTLNKNKELSNPRRPMFNNAPRITEQTVTTANDIGEETF